MSDDILIKLKCFHVVFKTYWFFGSPSISRTTPFSANFCALYLTAVLNASGFFFSPRWDLRRNREDDQQYITIMNKSLLHSKKRASWGKSAVGLLPCSHQADIWMRLHRLLRLDDNKFAASCQQAWCKLIVKIFYPQVRCKLFQQLAVSLQILSCNKSESQQQFVHYIHGFFSSEII